MKSSTLELVSKYQSFIDTHAPVKLARMAGYEAGQPSRTHNQATRYNSNPNSISAQIERVWAGWNGEYIAKNSALGTAYIRKRRNYASPQGWMANTGDTSLDRDVNAYVKEWMEEAGIDQSGWEAFSRIADVEMPARGDAALQFYRDEDRLRLIEITGDQIGELYSSSPRTTRDGLRYFAGMYMDPRSGLRKGARIYDKGWNDAYLNGEDYDASDIVYFQDNLFRGVRGMTIFHAAIVTMTKADTLFQYGIEAASLQAKTGVVVRSDSVGPIGEYTYDEAQPDGQTLVIQRNIEGAQTQYQYNGDAYEVIKPVAPGQELIEGCQYADERSAVAMGFPYLFLMNADASGGASLRFEIAGAGKEIERIRTMHSRKLKQVLKMALLDGIDRGIFRGAALTPTLWNGDPKFPALPTADAFREDQQDIAMNRAGCMTRQEIVAKDNKSFADVVKQTAREAMTIEMETQDANAILAKTLSPVTGLPYLPKISVADIAQNSDSPTDSAQAEQPSAIAPRIQSSGQRQVTDNPPNVTTGVMAVAVLSAYLGDVVSTDLNPATQAEISKILGIDAAQKKLNIVKYGMVASELEKMADPHNLESAHEHLKSTPNYECADAVHGSTEKHVLTLNGKVVDGHHFIAKALRGKVTKSLPTLDLTPARFQL